MAATPVRFVACTALEYTSKIHDAGTLYFVTDERRIYKGDEPFSGGIYKEVTSFPTPGEINTIYVNSTNGEVKYFNGTSYVQMVRPIATSITSTADHNSITTAKAVYDYVAAEIAKVDAGGISDTITELQTKVAALETDNTTNKADITQLKTDVAQLKTDVDSAEAAIDILNGDDTTEGSVAKAVKDAKDALQTNIDGKADKATTLAGYGIADAYTKTDADTAIAAAVANASHLTRSIVTTLPDVADAKDNVIYMVPKTGGSGDQKYDEYMFLNGAFEKIGDTAVALGDYATKVYVDTEIAGIKSDLNEGIQAAKDYADVLSDNYATAAQGAKADTAVQAVIEGTANGTIKVDGTDVAVHGLASAAYAETTDFDAAGAATTAETNAKAYADGLLVWRSINLDEGGDTPTPPTTNPSVDEANTSIDLDSSGEGLYQAKVTFTGVSGTPYSVSELNSNNVGKVTVNNTAIQASAVENPSEGNVNITYNIGENLEADSEGNATLAIDSGYALNIATKTNAPLSFTLPVEEKDLGTSKTFKNMVDGNLSWSETYYSSNKPQRVRITCTLPSNINLPGTVISYKELDAQANLIQVDGTTLSSGVGYTASGTPPLNMMVTASKYPTYYMHNSYLTSTNPSKINQRIEILMTYNSLLGNHKPVIKLLAGFKFTNQFILDKDITFTEDSNTIIVG